jgi:uroporphyrinogen III methyltransferase/synthase
VIGPATAAAVARWGGTASVIPETYRAEGLVDALLAGETGGVAGARVLLAGAREARSVLPEALVAAGAKVDVVVAYSTVVERGGERALVDLLDRKALDWVTFTASSAVKAYVDLVGTRTAGARVAVIGPITAETAEELGLAVAVQAVRYTTAGLVEALVEDACRAGGS